MTALQAKRVCRFSLPQSQGKWGCCQMPPAARSFATWMEGKLATPFHARNMLLELLGCSSEEDAMVFVSDAGWIGVVVVVEKDGGPERGGISESWRVLDFTLEQPGPPSCRRCGCTDDLGCPEGCSWVEPNLCSQCVQ
jgi:hypothetical protein